jgi:hypothetical protein
MAQTHVRALDSKNVFGAPLDDGVVVAAGDLVYYDNVTDNEFKLADADSVLSAATYIATHGQTGDGTNGKRLMCVKRAELYDEDAPFTAGSAIYLDTDTSSNLITDAARNLTHTAPTGQGDLVQKVGEAIDTKRAIVDLSLFGREVEVVGNLALLEGSAARLIVDNGPAAGYTLAAANDDITWHVAIPENAVAIVRGRIQYSCDQTLDASDTVSWSMASTDVGLANDVVTDSIAAAGAAVTADAVAEIDLSGGLDAASIVKPGGSLFVKATKAAEGSAGDDHTFFDPVITFKLAG